MVRRYDHPNALVRREHGGRSTAGASGTHVPLQVYQKVRLVAAHAQVVTAGTTTGAAAGLTVRIGTSSVGQITFGTSAAATTSSVGGAASPLGTATQYQVMNALGGADATIVSDITYEYEVLPDATLS